MEASALLGLSEGRLGDNNASRGIGSYFPSSKGRKDSERSRKALIVTTQLPGSGEGRNRSIRITGSTTNRHISVYLAYRLYSDLAGKTMLTMALTAPGSAEIASDGARAARHGDERQPSQTSAKPSD